MMQVCRGGLLAALLGGAAMPALADYVTVVSFGGASQKAQREAFYEPFKQATGDAVVYRAYNGDLAKLKQQLEQSHVSWDVIEVEAPELMRGCAEGLFERLEPGLAGNPADFVPGALQPCGVGIFVWSMALAYDPQRLREAPQGWRDFWDVRRLPGKRGLREGARYNLEFALMADGVAAKDVYRVLGSAEGVERAFRKLDELKPHIHWWKAGEEPIRALRDGRVLMSAAYNGRVSAARTEQPLALVWSGSIYDFDYWALPKGVWKGELARRFVAFASQPQQQKALAERIAYGPTNRQALALLDAPVAGELPTAEQNIAGAVGMDAEFWSQHGPALERRFAAWRKGS
ncbi:ABC transporter substrate-binding protein [Pseudomonas oryzae]|uniref:Putative spermidine/putrescine transport system substrate-binding protein n=1 Tax=Pseudomonas oryzae TaxID=1392877 RepID=A0A1H1X2Y3_9PSED|nr:ABC transporter substrate-binding protein [Pseudomonas oryzae]SDT02919.1 putative spermidine/putrescine transport system substrate-binding protein [Pseudomonas oryzae]